MSYNWYGANWQQDQGPMDHEVAGTGYIGYGVNGSSLDDMTRFRPNKTLEDCESVYRNETARLLKVQPNGFCRVSFDNILCWPPTPYNSVARVKCFSEFYGVRYDDTQNATRECTFNGTWSRPIYDSCTEVNPYSSDVVTQSNIYLIGYVISSITLALAIFIFTYFKELRCLRNKIHMNLMWSYLLTYLMWIIILIELNFPEHIAVTCVFVVTLLHYFHITTFFWMLVEGLYLYILVVRTLTRESFKLRIYALIGWGTPLLFIIIWAVIKGILLDSNVDENQAEGRMYHIWILLAVVLANAQANIIQYICIKICFQYPTYNCTTNPAVCKKDKLVLGWPDYGCACCKECVMPAGGKCRVPTRIKKPDYAIRCERGSKCIADYWSYVDGRCVAYTKTKL